MQSSADHRHDSSWEPRLNFNVLHLVCNSLLDVTDVLSFALTCSTLTESAFQRRLKMSPINLLESESVDQFHTFIFSNQAARAPSIYGLRLPYPRLYSRKIQGKSRPQITKNRLMALLEAAVHVQYIYLPTSTPEPLFDAVVKLTTVRELRVSVDDHRLPLSIQLTTFRSPLRFLHVVGDSHNVPISARFLHDHLGHFASTLKILDLDDFPLDIPPSSITTPFIEVRSLKLQYTCGPDVETLHVLVRLFPKLDNELVIGSLHVAVMEEDYPAFRQRSKEVQKTYTWSGLDLLDCDPQTAFLMAIECPIRRMSTNVTSRRWGRYLADSLRHNSPRQLHVRVSLFDGFDLLDGMFPHEAVANLTHLTLFVYVLIRYRCGARRKAKTIHWSRFVVSARTVYSMSDHGAHSVLLDVAGQTD